MREIFVRDAAACIAAALFLASEITRGSKWQPRFEIRGMGGGSGFRFLRGEKTKYGKTSLDVSEFAFLEFEKLLTVNEVYEIHNRHFYRRIVARPGSIEK